MSSWFSMGAGAVPRPEGAPETNGRRPNADLRIDRAAYPGWSTGAERVPKVGDEVCCSAGLGEIAAVLGKTGDGSRLLHIRLDDPDAPPFYAAASNVLISPDPPRPKPVAPAAPAAKGDDDEDEEEWLG
jgi:hypothetical protein